MSQRRVTTLELRHVCAALLTLLPLACAHGVEQEFAEDASLEQESGSGGSLQVGPDESPSAGKAMSSAGSAGAAVSNPFGGSSSTGGKASAGSGGAGGGSAGSGDEGGSSGSGGKASSGGVGGASAGSGSGPCGCLATKPWADNTVLNWAPGDCLTVGTATYKYTGTKAQTYANKQCNPTMQEPWCSDAGNDYKFMACP